MQIVLLELGERYVGLEAELKAFPGAELIRARDPATLASAMPGAEILIASNRLLIRFPMTPDSPSWHSLKVQTMSHEKANEKPRKSADQA